MTVAILGATSHIAKGLICSLPQKAGKQLELFSRDSIKVQSFVERAGVVDSCKVISGFDTFHSGDYSAVINCVGIGSPQKLKAHIENIFQLTEYFDKLVLAYLDAHPTTTYINFSSGAAYGSNFSSAVDEQTSASFAINALVAEDYYGIAKLHNEARHRSRAAQDIVDLRVFGYFSRFIDLEDRFLMSDIVRAILRDEELVTAPEEIFRDYVHPDDLVNLVILCLSHKPLNAVFDVCSVQPVSKFDLLDLFRERFGLRFRVADTFRGVSVTGTKDHYYSLNRSATRIGYQPRYAAIDALILETEKILADKYVLSQTNL